METKNDSKDEVEKKAKTNGFQAAQTYRTNQEQQINKYNTGKDGRTGHGFGAEDVNATIDSLKGKHVEKVGISNQKNGADRIVGKIQIQTKYCKTARQTVEAAFGDDGMYRYVLRNGKPMKLELPKDQFEEAIPIIEQKIREGKVKGVVNPNHAKKMVRKGYLTYDESKNVVKALNPDSIKYDVVTESINCASAAGISAVLVFAIAKHKGISNKEAAILAAKNGGKAACTQLLIGVTTRQIQKSAVNYLSKEASKLAAQKAVQVASTEVTKAGIRSTVSSTVSNVSTKALTGIAKVAKTNAATAAVTTVVVSAPHVYRAIKGKESVQECVEATSENAGSVVGGLVGGLKAGAACGAFFGPPGAIIGGIVGSIGGSIAGSAVTKTAISGIKKLFGKSKK